MLSYDDLTNRTNDIYIAHTTNKCREMCASVLTLLSNDKLSIDIYSPELCRYGTKEKSMCYIIPMHAEGYETRFFVVDKMALPDVAKILGRFGDSSYCNVQYSRSELDDIMWSFKIPFSVKING